MQINLLFEEITGGGKEQMNINRSLAILEAEMLCTGLHKSYDVLSALEYVRQHTAEELYQLSAFKADEIDRILKYWGGID